MSETSPNLIKTLIYKSIQLKKPQVKKKKKVIYI